MTNAEPDRLVPDPDRPSTWSKPPSWLLVSGADSTIPTPPKTRPQLLPFHDLAWEDFERLCLRLLELNMETVHAKEVSLTGEVTDPISRKYGQQGQAQYGIDLYSRDPFQLGLIPPKRRYVCLQARRIKKVTAAALRKSVSDFFDNKWSPATRKFIYATSCSGVSNQLADEFEAQAEKLAKESIELALWDQEMY